MWTVLETWLSPARLSWVGGLWAEGPNPSREKLIFNILLSEFSRKITG